MIAHVQTKTYACARTHAHTHTHTPSRPKNTQTNKNSSGTRWQIKPMTTSHDKTPTQYTAVVLYHVRVQVFWHLVKQIKEKMEHIVHELTRLGPGPRGLLSIVFKLYSIIIFGSLIHNLCDRFYVFVYYVALLHGVEVSKYFFVLCMAARSWHAAGELSVMSPIHGWPWAPYRNVSPKHCYILGNQGLVE